MRKQKWVETRKESELNDKGEFVTKKITYELDSYRQKEIIDLVLKFIPAIAIFIPVLIFSLQQKKEFDRQKKIFELETYTSTTTDIQVILNKKPNDADFKLAKDELYFKLYPKLKFLNDDDVINKVDTIKGYIDLYIAFDEAYNALQSMKFLLPPKNITTHITNQLDTVVINMQREILRMRAALLYRIDDFQVNYKIKFSQNIILSLAAIRSLITNYDTYTEKIRGGLVAKVLDDLNIKIANVNYMAYNQVRGIILQKNSELDSVLIGKINFQ